MRPTPRAPPVVLSYVVLRAIGGVAGELILLVLALIIALGLDPMVSWLVRRGWRRWRS